MSASAQPDRQASEVSAIDGAQDAGRQAQEADSLPVLGGSASVLGPYPLGAQLVRRSSSPLASVPAVQAAAVAAGSFLAGAAVARLLNRRQRRSAALLQGARIGLRRSPAPGRRSRASSGELLQIVASRSLLVDVHLLGERDQRS